MDTCLPPSPGALYLFLLLVTSILTTILRPYIVFQCAWILYHVVQHASKALRDLPSEEGQNTIAESQPQQQPDFELLDGDIDDIAVPVLEPQRPELTHGSDSGDSDGLLDGPLDDLTIPSLEPRRAGRSGQLRSSQAAINSASKRKSETTKPTISTTALDAVMNSRTHLLATAQWDGKIRWAISGPSIFDDDQEELDAVLNRRNILSNEPPSSLRIFQYGLRYMPLAGADNAYRTVKIDCPLSSSSKSTTISLNQVLAELRGLELYSARLFDTAHLTGRNTAIVVFIRQRDAFGFLQWTAGSGLRLGSLFARVSLVNTPTYPIPADLADLICQEGYSRSLLVCNLRDTLKTELQRVLYKSNCRDFVETLEDGYVAGEICVRFHSVRTAAIAFEILKKHPCFGNCQFRFQKPVAMASGRW